MAVLIPVIRWAERLLLIGGFLAAGPLLAQSSTEEALAGAFPGAALEAQTAYLTAEQVEAYSALAGPGIPLETEIIRYHIARRAGEVVGYAYLDVHRVRTHREVLLIAISPAGSLVRIETVRFQEPPEYQAPEGWLAQFEQRSLDERLSLKGSIAPIAGATLTAVAVTTAARRTLALHRLITGSTPDAPPEPS